MRRFFEALTLTAICLLLSAPAAMADHPIFPDCSIPAWNHNCDVWVSGNWREIDDQPPPNTIDNQFLLSIRYHIDKKMIDENTWTTNQVRDRIVGAANHWNCYNWFDSCFGSTPFNEKHYTQFWRGANRYMNVPDYFQNLDVCAMSALQTGNVGVSWLKHGATNYDFFGRTEYCLSSNLDIRPLRPFKVFIALNRERTLWHVTHPDLPPSNKHDLMTVVVHEFGHANGFMRRWDPGGYWQQNGHFSEFDATCYEPPPGYPPNPDPATMCPGIQLGEYLRRTINTHDRTAFYYSYCYYQVYKPNCALP